MQSFLHPGWVRALVFNARPLSAQIKARETGTAAPSQSGRVCLFAHYDPHGIVDPYVFHYLAQLRGLDADILFVSTASSLRSCWREATRPDDYP